MLHVAFLGIGHVLHLHQACQWASVAVTVGLAGRPLLPRYAYACVVVARRILWIGRGSESRLALAIKYYLLAGVDVACRIPRVGHGFHLLQAMSVLMEHVASPRGRPCLSFATGIQR